MHCRLAQTASSFRQAPECGGGLEGRGGTVAGVRRVVTADGVVPGIRGVTGRDGVTSGGGVDIPVEGKAVL